MSELKFKDDNRCFVCGKENPSGLQLSFYLKDGKAVSEFTLSEIFQGYAGIIHGGIVAMILDEAIAQAIILMGYKAVTMQIEVKFKRPLIPGESARVEAEIRDISGRIIEGRSRMIGSDSRLIAEASARFIRVG